MKCFAIITALKPISGRHHLRNRKCTGFRADGYLILKLGFTHAPILEDDDDVV